jgi:hypothetical protein
MISAQSVSCHLPPIVAMNGAIPSGPLLLKLITTKAHVDLRATALFVCLALGHLDVKMIELCSNVIKFNLCVTKQIQILFHRAQESEDLLVNRIMGCKAAQDVEFTDLIRRKENECDEGRDFTVDSLMADVLAKCHTRVVIKKQWGAPTTDQQQILALTARATALAARIEEFKLHKPPKQAKTPGGGVTPKKPNKANKWAWKNVLPEEREPATKNFEGKSYHVNCPWHPDQRVCHSIDECTKNPKNAGGGPAAPSGASASCRLQKAQLAAALLEESKGAEEEEEDL